MIKRLKRWWRTRRIIRDCGCVCFCSCGNPLNDGERDMAIHNAQRIVYHCGDCGTYTSFDFGIAPVPIKVKEQA